MTLEYNLDSQIKSLSTVLDEYTEWFMQAVRRISYPDAYQDHAALLKPKSFVSWIDDAKNVGFQAKLIERLDSLHADLTHHADEIIDKSLKSLKTPKSKDFDTFVVLFEEFFHHLRRLEIDCLLEDSGIDTLTGLRSKSVLAADLSREMERLSRQGKPFSLGLVRIDNFETIEQTGDVDAVLKSVARKIQRSLRSFDDAYNLGSGEFMLSLKQTEMSGGVTALERLKDELSRKNDESGLVEMTMSSCVAEPVPGDNLHELVNSLNAELNSHDKSDVGAVLEYFEVSSLQRYIQSEQE